MEDIHDLEEDNVQYKVWRSIQIWLIVVNPITVFAKISMKLLYSMLKQSLENAGD